MEIYSYLLAFIIFHGMILSQTSCMLNAISVKIKLPPIPRRPPRLPPLPPLPRRRPRRPSPRPPPPSKVLNDGLHTSLPPPQKILPPPHTYGSPRYPPSPPPQRS
ncbi:hypothetical protein POPTR_019G017302v4 [Populus trichocarpa]|uniref:Uncharacterized protein n=1 Tax=Populus trichocarpa TaxID=3694 RepID=A0ACC0RIJ7_POPTR|nr:hypothetical protein POPTR_019G017302v4 [Populus trichocarpa]